MIALSPAQLQQLAVFNGTAGSRVQAAILHDKIAELIATANHEGLHLTTGADVSIKKGN